MEIFDFFLRLKYDTNKALFCQFLRRIKISIVKLSANQHCHDL